MPVNRKHSLMISGEIGVFSGVWANVSSKLILIIRYLKFTFSLYNPLNANALCSNLYSISFINVNK